ncbi:PPK2 family polyphosphate kinase [Ramlibacter sp. Leaf400]|uniref:PPK2 family polyphosphate kinase n=1 Tax=Ramlibacter sp. Leaf400 TaxID=1736365 RepID=UPI0007014F00|nr:PPK2 family polyphosphate kinase [Ramlibacter sp. Leaf400]KQT08888.1 phosphate--nucleotide phosphotransferase [Ramlibacter sp. Leaf400]
MAAASALRPLTGASGARAWKLDRPRPSLSLDEWDPASQPFGSGDKATDKREVEELSAEIDQLQDVLFADRRFKLLVVLQGPDASGKDGTIRKVFGQVSPLGVLTCSWGPPSEEESAHDFLWRIHQRVPKAGELMLFNRSHYEDVLVPLAEHGMKQAQALERCRQIVDFERMLAETGTVILKFKLLISKAEQARRLQARMDDPTKAWKLQAHDLEARKHWAAYRKAYELVLAATASPFAPWILVPADSKTHRNLMIAQLVRHQLKSMKLRYPPIDPALAGAAIR